MIKEGIWKILLRNDRLQKSCVRRIKKQLEHLNKVGCLKPVVPVLFCFSRVGGWDTELIVCVYTCNVCYAVLSFFIEFAMNLPSLSVVSILNAVTAAPH